MYTVCIPNEILSNGLFVFFMEFQSIGVFLYGLYDLPKFRTVTFLVSSFKYLHSYHPLARSKYLVLSDVKLFLESGIELFQLPLQLVSLCLLCHSVLSMLFSYTYNGDDKLFALVTTFILILYV